MIRAAGFLLGLVLVALVVLSGRVAGGHVPAGAAVTVTAVPTGELALGRTGPLVVAELHPGEAAAGATVVRNQTGRSLAVRLRATPSLPDLDRLLRLELAPAGAPERAALVGALRGWSRPIVIRSGEERRLAVRTWLPAGLREGYQGRVVEVELELRGRPVGR